MLELEELNSNNYDELSRLRILPSQKSFVKDFNGCIKYKEENPFLKIYGIKDKNKFVGLTAFARWDSDLNIPLEDRWTWLDELFIDYRFQHMGYGKKILPIIIAKINEIYNPKFIILSVKNENSSAKRLYKELGFIETNLVYIDKTDSIEMKEKPSADDEIIMKRYN